jgi:hypothetical protein
MEIPVSDNFNSVLGSHYFFPGLYVKIVELYLYFLGKILSTNSLHLILFGYVKASIYDLSNGASVHSFITTIKLQTICSLWPRLIRLTHRNDSVYSSSLLHLAHCSNKK